MAIPARTVMSGRMRKSVRRRRRRESVLTIFFMLLAQGATQAGLVCGQLLAKGRSAQDCRHQHRAGE